MFRLRDLQNLWWSVSSSPYAGCWWYRRYYSSCSANLYAHCLDVWEFLLKVRISCEYTDRETSVSVCGNETGTDTEWGIALFHFNFFFWKKKCYLCVCIYIMYVCIYIYNVQAFCISKDLSLLSCCNISLFVKIFQIKTDSSFFPS